MLAEKDKAFTPEAKAAAASQREAGIKETNFKNEWRQLSKISLAPNELSLRGSPWPITVGNLQYSPGGYRLGIPDPQPSLAHLGPEGDQFRKAMQWTEPNLIKVQGRAQSHGERPTLGGWEHIEKGTNEEIQRNAMIKINDIVHHPQVEAFIWNDRRVGRSLRFRIPAPEAVAQLLPARTPAYWTNSDGRSFNLYNRGIGVAYDASGVIHFLNED